MRRDSHPWPSIVLTADTDSSVQDADEAGSGGGIPQAGTIELAIEGWQGSYFPCWLL